MILHALTALLPLADPEPWFSSRDAGLIGGLGGASIGVVCGIFGAIVGSLAPRGIGRKAVLGFAVVIIVIAAAVLLTGIYALAVGQPYHVYYPMLLLGFVPTLVMGGLFPSMRRRYDAAEQRKMDADALRRS